MPQHTSSSELSAHQTAPLQDEVEVKERRREERLRASGASSSSRPKIRLEEKRGGRRSSLPSSSWLVWKSGHYSKSPSVWKSFYFPGFYVVASVLEVDSGLLPRPGIWHPCSVPVSPEEYRNLDLSGRRLHVFSVLYLLGSTADSCQCVSPAVSRQSLFSGCLEEHRIWSRWR